MINQVWKKEWGKERRRKDPDDNTHVTIRATIWFPETLREVKEHIRKEERQKEEDKKKRRYEKKKTKSPIYERWLDTRRETVELRRELDEITYKVN